MFQSCICSLNHISFALVQRLGKCGKFFDRFAYLQLLNGLGRGLSQPRLFLHPHCGFRSATNMQNVWVPVLKLERFQHLWVQSVIRMRIEKSQHEGPLFYARETKTTIFRCGYRFSIYEASIYIDLYYADLIVQSRHRSKVDPRPVGDSKNWLSNYLERKKLKKIDGKS